MLDVTAAFRRSTAAADCLAEYSGPVVPFTSRFCN